MSGAPKNILSRLSTWVIGAAGAIIIGLAAAWTQYFFGPNGAQNADSYEYSYLGVKVSCNLPLGEWLDVSGAGGSGDSGDAIAAFLVIGGTLQQGVLSTGEAEKLYRCDLYAGEIDERYMIKLRLNGPEYTNSEGKTCRGFWETANKLTRIGGGLVELDPDEIDGNLREACLGSKGTWEVSGPEA